MRTRRSVVVGVAGGSASGKSTLVARLPGFLPGATTSLLRHDDYYHSHSHLSADARAALDFDRPEALDNRMLAGHIRALCGGAPVRSPEYCFETHTRLHLTREVAPADVLLIDGMLLLAVAELRELLDVAAYVDVPADIRLAWRVLRDVGQRGRTVGSVIDQYLATVRPGHESFVEPSKVHADIIVTDARDEAQVRAVAELVRPKLGW